MQKHHFYYLLFLLWFSYLITSSLLLFMKGFLLTRVALPHNSTCLTHHSAPQTCHERQQCEADSTCHGRQLGAADSVMDSLYDASRTCLPQRAKVVLLVVDALRYDFAAYDSDNRAPAAYQNKLTVVRDALREFPHSARLYRFVADPPTTTMQRLKALTTGSLPTFIDAGSNFATAEINEDNLIDQLRKLNKQVVFMGDDTWTGLYPNRFVRTYDFPSFNVFDLDTVDNGVKSQLFAELATTDWDLLIGHFLGVDHCGHRYGPAHKEMERKLQEMNQVIGDVIKQLDENTVLFVIGDHGMTASGDHGGESEEEVTAAMFVYSKLPLVVVPTTSDTMIKQIDLVPTLSAILGVPIPYSNLGAVVLDSLPESSWQSLLFSLWSNVQQMTEYINEYASSTGTFEPDAMRSVREKFSVLNARVRTIRDPTELSGFTKSAREYMSFLRRMCEEVWVKFDSSSMSRGLLLSFLTTFFVYLIISGIPTGRLPEIFVSPFVPCSYAALAVTAIATYFVASGEPSAVFFATGIVSVFMLAVLVVQNWAVIALHWYGLSRKRNFTFIVYRVCLLFGVCCLFSNSYIVEEDKVSLFLTLTSLLITIYDCDVPFAGKTRAQPKKSKPNKPLEVKVKLVVASILLVVLIRASTGFWKCREEQNCLTEKDSSKTHYILTLVLLGVFVTVSRSWLKLCGNLTGFSPTTMVCRYCPTIMVVCTGGFWALRRLPKDGKYDHQADLLVRTVYGSALLGLLTLLASPLRLYVLPDKSGVEEDESRMVAYVFNRIKGLLGGYRGGEDESSVPVVYGLATVYSSAFFVLAMFLCLLLALLIGDVAAASLVILTISAGFVLVVTSIARYEKVTNTAQLFEVPNSSILVWFFYSVYFFYGTGHQPTFPNIQWEAAFLGTGQHFRSNLIPGALVVANTFGSYFVMGVTLPLVLTSPFALYSMFPGLSSRKGEMLKDCSRGEVVLYENNGRMLSTAFVVSCKYILLHCLRAFASMLSATIHCRHLMVWKIFAPKLIFEAIGLLVTVASVLVGYLFLMYVNHSLHKLVAKLRTTRS